METPFRFKAELRDAIDRLFAILSAIVGNYCRVIVVAQRSDQEV